MRKCEHRRQGKRPADLDWRCLDCGALIDGPEGTHYYGDTCLGGHGELADIEAAEAAPTDGSGGVS